MKLSIIFILCFLFGYGNTLEYSSESPTSVFTIDFIKNNGKTISGKFCYVTRNGAKIDCDNQFSGVKKNNQVYFDFNSSFGGKNGKAMITFISEKQILWELLKKPIGEFYVPKKMILSLDDSSSKKDAQVELKFDSDCKMAKIKIDDDIYKKLDGENCKIINYKKHKLLFVYTNGMVNQCGVLLYSKKNNIYNGYVSNEELCNVKIYNDILISSYRDSAKWFYKYYRINNTSLKLISKNKLNITPKTLTPYNNIAYYLQKAGANEEAIFLLEKIIQKFPNRTVAYYNLGDAYWALGKKQKAIKAYTTYVEQMCHKSLQKKIPNVVLERVNHNK